MHHLPSVDESLHDRIASSMTGFKAIREGSQEAWDGKEWGNTKPLEASSVVAVTYTAELILRTLLPTALLTAVVVCMPSCFVRSIPSPVWDQQVLREPESGS